MEQLRLIDRQIAELMGYTVVDDYNLITDNVYVTDEGLTRFAVENPRSFIDLPLLPDYSIDWSAMRVLVEWLQGKGKHVTICLLANGEVTVMLDNNQRELTRTESNTAPLALCKAVLSLPKGVLKSE